MAKINIIILFLLEFSLILSQKISQLSYGSGAIRSMTKLNNGKIIGGRSSGHEIEVWESINQGINWNRIGTVASNKEIEYGDVMFLSIPKTDIVYCAFREYNSEKHFSIVVCISDNGGVDWIYDSTVISGQTLFVGAPWLFLAQNGDLQCYYDSEPLARNNGDSGSQWIAMQGKNGLEGDWDKYNIVTASRDENINKLVRDGMASVIDLGNNRIMVVTEGVEDEKSGGEYSNVIRAIQSFDGGKTWDYKGRRIVYKSGLDETSKRTYNAYCPMGIRIGGGPVGVIFCTDEDFGGMPDMSSQDVTKRRCHIKFIQTLDNFETWGNLKDIWTEGRQAYAPGMIEVKSNDVLISIDHFGGNQRFLRYK